MRILNMSIISNAILNMLVFQMLKLMSNVRHSSQRVQLNSIVVKMSNLSNI